MIAIRVKCHLAFSVPTSDRSPNIITLGGCRFNRQLIGGKAIASDFGVWKSGGMKGGGLDYVLSALGFSELKD